jgi:hypothetical protein
MTGNAPLLTSVPHWREFSLVEGGARTDHAPGAGDYGAAACGGDRHGDRGSRRRTSHLGNSAPDKASSRCEGILQVIAASEMVVCLRARMERVEHSHT